MTKLFYRVYDFVTKQWSIFIPTDGGYTVLARFRTFAAAKAAAKKLTAASGLKVEVGNGL